MLSLMRLYSNMLLLGSTALTVMLDPNAAKAADSRPEPTQNSAARTEPLPLPPLPIDQDQQTQQQHQQQPHTFNDALQVCFSKRQHSALECLNRGALTAIESWNDNQCLDFGNVQLLKVESEGRAANLLDLDWDPKEFGSVLRAASRMLERRNVKWDLGYIYPGLQMRVGPTLSTENGVLEFVMDERHGGGHHHYHNRQLGSGKMLIRHLVLPFLLGFKFNLASLLPLLFGVLIVITKKALILTKIALFVAGLLGWNSFFGGGSGGSGYNQGTHGFNQGYYANSGFGYGQSPLSGGHPNGGYGGGINLNLPNNHAGYQQHTGYPPSSFITPYRTETEGSEGFPFGQHVIREIVNVYDGAAHQETKESNSRRKKSYAWPRNEA